MFTYLIVKDGVTLEKRKPSLSLPHNLPPSRDSNTFSVPWSQVLLLYPCSLK